MEHVGRVEPGAIYFDALVDLLRAGSST